MYVCCVVCVCIYACVRVCMFNDCLNFVSDIDFLSQ